MLDAFYGLYLCVLLVVTAFGASRWRIADTATKIIIVYVCLTLLTELLAYITAWLWQTNMVVYCTYSVVELVCLTTYFSRFSARRRYLNGTLGGLMILLLITAFTIGSLEIVLSLFRLSDALIIPALALAHFRRALKSGLSVRLDNNVHFWIACVLLFYRCANVCYWVYTARVPPDADLQLAAVLLIVVNTGCALMLGGLFYNYHKLQTGTECTPSLTGS